MDDTNTVVCCAECGEGGADLKMCNACKHARYCSVTCQRRHWPSHKKECKQHAARLHDESLFKQPPPKEDCPICFLPMSSDMTTCKSCCGKIVCYGCMLSCLTLCGWKCAFCNAKLDTDEDSRRELLMNRVEANDANAITHLGCAYADGSFFDLRQDYKKSFELWTRAAELGSSKAHNELFLAYSEGLGVEKDTKKAIHHYELAAMAGHEEARFSLGFIEYESGNMERAMKHWVISASAGDGESMPLIKRGFKTRHVKRDVYELTLKAYNDSCDAMRRGKMVPFFAKIMKRDVGRCFSSVDIKESTRFMLRYT
jgi:TPR repeat protein